MTRVTVREMGQVEASEFLRLAAEEGVSQSLESGVVSPKKKAELVRRYEAYTPDWKPLDLDLLVAGDADGTTIGGTWLRHESENEESFITIMHVSIYENYRGLGHSNKLMLAALDLAYQRWNTTKVMGYILPSNDVSHNFAKSLGAVHLYTVFMGDIAEAKVRLAASNHE